MRDRAALNHQIHLSRAARRHHVSTLIGAASCSVSNIIAITFLGLGRLGRITLVFVLNVGIGVLLLDLDTLFVFGSGDRLLGRVLLPGGFGF